MLTVLVLGVGYVDAQTAKRSRLVITMIPVGAWHALAAKWSIVTMRLEHGAEERSIAEVKNLQKM